MPKQAFLTRVKLLVVAISLLTSSVIYAQTTVPFEKRYENTGINGELYIIGNSILGHPTEIPYNGLTQNNFIDMVFVDIDNNANTFNSSSATFTTNACNRVVYAGLYWGAVITPTTVPGSTSAPNEVWFRVPGGSYQNVVADITNAAAREDLDRIYYKDVTNLMNTSGNPSGEYFVANINSSEGTSSSAGWSLVIVYEDPNEPRKFISTFDGFSAVNNAPNEVVSFSYSGFVTPPSGPVEGKVGVAALEGDYGWQGDRMQFRADANATFTDLYDAANPVDNFFNSRITSDGAIVYDRNLSSENTLGWDQKLLDLTALNAGNSLIGNNETGATVRVRNDVGGDWIYTFLNTFSVNIIEPVLQVLTSVEDDLGNPITLNSPVPLGATVWYNLNFQNVGTDNAQNAYILNTLPINVTLDDTTFEFLDDTGNPLPAGLITQTYNPVTRVVRFDIDDSLLLRESDPANASYNIRYQVTASNNCFDYTDACTNILVNSLESYYDGETSGTNVSGQPGLNGINGCGLGNPGSMDLFVDTSSCQFDTVLEFCNNNLTITGDDGYNIYEWRDEDGNLLAANSKTIVVTGPGVYTCTQTKVGCTVTTRTVTVNGLDVEFNPFNNQCKDSADGGVTIDVTDDAATFNYELSQGGTPLSSTGLITAKSHTFNDLDIGTYDVRVTNNEGCFDIFSFEVQEPTLLTASNVVIDNIMPCNGNSLSGRIEVTGNGGTIFTGGTNEYEYSMDGGAFQTSNIFETTQEGNHTMTVRDANGCTTTTIATIDFDEEIEYVMEKQDVLCYQGTDGSITVNLAQNNAGNTLTYSIDGGANFQSNPTFSGLAKGDYQIIIRKEKGVNTCDITESITLLEQIDLQFEAVGGFSCEGATNIITATVAAEFAGDVTYRINGGSANSTGIFEDVNQGTHTITVQQNSTGCSAEPITIVIDQYIPVSFIVEQNVSSPALRDYIVNAVNGTPDYEYAMLKNPSETVSPEVTDEDFGSSNVFTPPSAGFYTFYVRDARGCIVEEIVEFKDIEIPNFFTPNGDTVNDEWYPRNIELYPNISVQIFDRYQRLIATYQGNDQEGWNGIYKGKELPTGDYWYIVKLNEPTDNREFKGNFTLHRVIN